MKIISNFRDYYDGVATHDSDREHVLVRNTPKEPLSISNKAAPEIYVKPPYIYLPSLSSVYVNILGFAGKLYPHITLHIKTKGPNYYKTLTYDIKDQIIFDRDVAESMFGNAQQMDGLSLREFWALADNTDFVHACFRYADACQFEMGWNRYAEETWFRRNIRLLDYSFGKIVHPVEAYGQLQTWVWSQRRPERPIPEMSDELKAHQHGFSLKSSFRRNKGGGPARKRKPTA